VATEGQPGGIYCKLLILSARTGAQCTFGATAVLVDVGDLRVDCVAASNGAGNHPAPAPRCSFRASRGAAAEL
jgi:hypothetical protein